MTTTKKTTRPAEMFTDTARATKPTRGPTTTPQTSSQPTTVNAKMIAERAYRLWESRGCQHGHDLEHWLEAEKQLRNEQSRR